MLRVKHYSPRTEEAYVDWITRFIRFHDKRHPAEMDAPEIEAFLTHLAVKEKVAASTQNQALAAILFLYREVFLWTSMAVSNPSAPPLLSVCPPSSPKTRCSAFSRK
ncbi:phage integrase N-terminal SAM-like domain-containing protein [Chloroflexus aggregans]|nr:phage integrase N-terminal SAM-like domain-containing protein [Chloroflexus aggregans]